MTFTGLYLDLQTMAVDLDPRDAVRQCIAVSERIGIMVHANINGVDVYASPEDHPELLVQKWEEALQSDRRHKIVMLGVNR